MPSFLTELEGLTKAATPAQVAAPAPAAVVLAATPEPAAESAPQAVETAPVTPVESHEPKIVEYTPEPEAPAPKRTPLVDPEGKLRAYQLEDGTLIAVTRESIEDPLAGLSDVDRAPIIPEDEARVDLSQRTSGRISFLAATYESEKEDPAYPARREKRLKNDLHRALFAKPRSEFNPEDTAVAKELKRWIQ